MQSGVTVQLRLNPRYAWPWSVAAPLSAIAIVFLVTFFDPFGFESATKNQSANIFYKIYAAAYPSINQSKISVVLLDDPTLQHFDEPWPPSHLVHGQVLDAILSFKPAAVLVDIFFVHARPDDHFDYTDYVIRNYNEARVPLFMVAAGASTRAPSPARIEILRLFEAGLVHPVSAEVTNYPGQPLLYPLHPDESGRAPAALAIYRNLCDAHAIEGCHAIPVESHDEMEIVWGLRPDQFNCERAAGTNLAKLCNELYTSVVGRTVQLVWEAPFPSDWRATDPVRLPYHAAISTVDLLDGGKRARLQPLLENRIVIYGADVALVKDSIDSPVHGPIAGAFTHAMALDNLLTLGDAYVRRGAGHETFRREWTEFVPVAFMTVAAGFIIVVRNRWLRELRLKPWDQGTKHRLKESDERLLRWVYYSFLLLIVAVGAFEFFYLRFSPINWLGLLVVIHFAHWMEGRFFGRRNGWSQFETRRYHDAGALAYNLCRGNRGYYLLTLLGHRANSNYVRQNIPEGRGGFDFRYGRIGGADDACAQERS